MDLKKRKIHSLQGLIVLILFILPAAASTNINCDGRAFHCVNSTHFIICVDVGGGQSKTIDNFVIPCPPTTECKMNNRLECEFPPVTLPMPLFEPLKSTVIPIVVDTTILPQHSFANTESPQNVPEITTDNYFNTVSPTTVSEERINANEATFAINDNTISNINEVTVAPQLTTRYIDNEFMISTNAQHTTKNPIDEIRIVHTTAETTLYEFSSLQSIGTVTDATIDMKTNQDLLEYAAQNKIEYFNNETNIQSTPGVYVTGSTLSSTFVLMDVNTTKMPETINPHISELTSINNRENNTSIPSKSMDLTTGSSNLIANQITSTSSGKDDTSETLSITNTVDKKYSGLLLNDAVTTNPNMNSKSYMTGYELPIQSTLKDKGDITTEIIVPRENRVTFRSTGMEIFSKTLITTLGTEKNDSTLLPNKLTTTLPTIESIDTPVDVTTIILPVTYGIQQNHSPVFLNNTEITTSNNNLTKQSSSVNEGFIVVDATMESTVSTVTDLVSENSGKVPIVSDTLFTTDVMNQNCSNIASSDKVTIGSNILTSSDVISSNLPTQSSNIHEVKIMHDASMQTIVSTVTETAFVDGQIGVNSNTQFTTDGLNQNYTSLTTNNIATTAPNDATSHNVSTGNKLSTQSSSINEVVVMPDTTIETTVSIETDISSANNGTGVTSKTQFTTDVFKQNHSAVNTNNIVTTSPDIATSSVVSSNNKFPTKGLSTNAVVTLTDATTETTVSTINDRSSINSGIGVTSETPFATDVFKQNESDINTNNTVTTAPNVATSSAVSSNNKFPTKGLSTYEVVTKSNATTVTTVSTVTEITSVNSGIDVTSETPSVTDVFKQNYSDININNIVTTAPTNATSSAVSSNNKSSTQGSSTNAVVTFSDATTETTVSTINDRASINSGIGVTSETPFATDVFKQNESDINTNNTVTTAPNVATSSAVSSNNKFPTKGLSTNEVVTKSNATTETTVSTVTEITSVNSGIDVTSETSSVTDVFKQNYSDININNIVTTAPTNATSSAVSSNNKSPTQGSSTNAVVTFSDATTETTVSTINDRASINSGIGVTSETPFPTDVIKQNYSDINTNNIVTAAPNIATSSAVSSNNKSPTKGSSTNAVVTMTDATTETTLSTINDRSSKNSGIGVISETPFVTDVFKQNYSDININNIVTTAPNNTTSSAVSSNNKSPTQGSSTNAVVTLTDATTETTVSTINDRASINSGIGVTSETPFATDVFKQNESDINTNNTVTTAPNVATSSAVSSNNKFPTKGLSTNEVVTKSNATTETTVSTVTEITSVNSGIDVTSETSSVTDVFKQNYSDININNIVTTAPTNATSSAVSSNNKSSTQGSSTNAVVTFSDATTETTVSTINDRASINSGIGVTSETPFATDVFKQNESDINTNNTVTTAPNVATSSAVSSNNKFPTKGLSTNEVVTKSNATTETTVSTVTEITSVNSGIDVTSETSSVTDVFKQNYSDININNIVTTAPTNATSSAVSSNNKSPTQGSSTNAVVTFSDATTETTVSTINDRASINSGIGVTSETPFPTDVFKQNYSDINTNNIVTAAPNIATSSAVSSNNKSPTKGSSTNAVVTMTDATTETTLSTINDRSSKNSGIGVISETPFVTDVFKQNYSDININNIVTTAPNNTTSSAVSSNNKSPTQGSSTNAVVTLTDATTETTVSTINDRASINSGIGVTSETPFATDVFKQNESDINTNNTVTTAPNVATSSAVSSNNKFPTKGLSTNEVVTKSNATTETTVSTVTEITSVNSGIDVTSETSSVTDVFKQNYSDININNIVTTAPTNATSSAVSSNNKSPTQGSSTNAVVTFSDATTETTVSTINDRASINSGIGVTSETPFPTDVFKQNYSDINTNNIVTAAPNIATSSAVSSNNKSPTQGSSTNAVVTLTDATTETTVYTTNDRSSLNSGIGVTSETPFANDVFKQNESDINRNNTVTTAPNVATSSAVSSNNKLPIQGSSTNAVVTLTDATTETTVSTINDRSSINSGIGVTSKTPFATDVFKQNESDINTNNTVTTAPNVATSSAVSSNNKLPIQGSSTNAVVTLTDATTETTVSTINDRSSINSGIGVTSETPFATDVFKQNESDINTNNTVTTAPNVATSSAVSSNNKLPIQGSSTNAVVTLTDATTETMVSTINNRSSINSGIGVTSETLFATDVFKQNESDINTNNTVTTAPNNTTSSAVSSNNKFPTQGLNTNEVVTMLDATTETTVSTVTEITYVNSGIEVTSETPFVTDVFNQNYSDINTNNIVTTAPNIATSSVVSSNNKGSSTNEVVIMSDATTETMVSIVTEVTSVKSEIGATSETLFPSDVFKQNYSDLITDNIVTTISNVFTSLDVQNNTLPTTLNLEQQGSSLNEIFITPDTNMKIMDSTVTVTDSIYSGQAVVTTKTLFTTDGIKKNYSVITNNVATTIPSVVTISDELVNKDLLIQSSSLNEAVITAGATKETITPTATAIVSVSNTADVTTGNLFSTEAFKKKYSDILTNNKATTVPDMVTSFDNSINKKLSTKTSSINQTGTTAETIKEITSTVTSTISESNTKETITPTVTSTVSESSNKETITPTATATVSVSNIVDVTSRALFTTAVLNQNDKIINNISAAIPDIVTNSYAIKWTPSQKSSTHEVNTRSTNAFTDIRFDQHDYSNVKLTSHESLETTDVSLNIEDSIKSERKIERRKNTTSPDTNFKNKDSSSEGNTRLMINDFPKSNLTDDGHLNISLSGNKASSVTTLLLNTSAQENVFRTQNENYQTMDSNIQIYNISNKNTQNRSIINAEIQSNIMGNKIINNMPNVKQRNSYNINNSYRNTDNMRKTKFTCLRRARGRYADGNDCRKFYICIGREEPIAGICPFGTVFSEIRKQCTNNLSHCIRNYQFRCTSVGRFSGSLQNNVYYICLEDESGKFIRFNFQCQNGYYLNKTSLLCSPRIEDTSQSVSSSSDSSNTDGDQTAIKFSSHDSLRSASSVFQCKREGKFADPSNCRRYYECSRSRKLGYKIKRKICDDDQIFNKDRKKCVDDDSLES